MKRLTTNVPRDNIETALNLFYIKDHETWVRGGGSAPDYPDVSLFDFTRAMIRTQLPDVNVPGNDHDFSAMMAEWLFDDADTKESIIATLYTAAWAFAELRGKLMRYEELEEEGRLLKLPCKLGETMYRVIRNPTTGKKGESEQIRAVPFSRNNLWNVVVEGTFGKTVFLTREEAEVALQGVTNRNGLGDGA